MAEPNGVPTAPVDVTMANLLESFEVGHVDSDDWPVLVCGTCNEDICTVELGDTMRVLLNTVLGHATRKDECKPL